MSNGRTLNPLAAHNAVAALVDVYSGILADYERNLTLLQAQGARDKATHEEQLKEGRGVNLKLIESNQELRMDNQRLSAERAQNLPPIDQERMDLHRALVSAELFHLFEEIVARPGWAKHRAELALLVQAARDEYKDPEEAVG